MEEEYIDEISEVEEILESAIYEGIIDENNKEGENNE